MMPEPRRGSVPAHNPDAVASLIEGCCTTPFAVLGVREAPDGGPCTIRTMLSWAETVTAVWAEDEVPLVRVHPDGLFEAHCPAEAGRGSYHFQVTDRSGQPFRLVDPYAFAPGTDPGRYAAFLDGTERRAHQLLGARREDRDGVAGTRFAVWAPGAHNVNLMGEFNRWDARCHPMASVGSTGVWELFVPGVAAGTHYKYSVVTADDHTTIAKADPFGRAMELRPASASIVVDHDTYDWGDDVWQRDRPTTQRGDKPISIYEVHLGSWKRKPDANPREGSPGWLSYRELADDLIPYVRDLGFTHIELLPVAEHPLDGSWGYQVVGYFAATSRHGTPDDLRYFADRAHQAGLGVLVDFVPAHFPRDGHGLARFDGTHVFEDADPRRGAHPDWGTLVFNYGRGAVRSFLISSAVSWLEDFHFDGLRVDAVASMLYLDYSRADGDWLPNEHGGNEHLEAVTFLRALNDAVHAECPGALVIAEESTSWPGVTHPTADEEGGLGFDLKWNMGWMNDTLSVMVADPLYRKALHQKLTFGMWYAGSERFLLPLSHDEVVHMKGSLLGKMPGDTTAQLANLRLLLAYQWLHPGKKLLFMGGEIGQPGEWNDEGEIAWDLLDGPGHRGLQALIRDLNRLYVANHALHLMDLDPAGFEWLDCHDAERTTLSFIRWAPDWTDPVIVVANFTPVSWTGFQLPVPHPGTYRLVLNTGGELYEVDDPHELAEAFESVEGELHGREQFVQMDLPPLGVVALVWEGAATNHC